MEILDKYIELIEKGYCDDCNELNCIGNYPHKKIAQEIKNLQQENQQLKKSIKLLTNDLANMTNRALQLEKQKDDVVEFLKNHILATETEEMILRMLGEIDVED